MAHVAAWKHEEVSGLTSLLTKNKVIGVAGIGGIPAPQLQQMRQHLRDVAGIRSAKNSLLFRALDEAEKKVKGVVGLKEAVTGQTALIVTEINPFNLFREIKATKTMAPAKGGEIAAHDIIVRSGDTPFKPGPIVGELQKVGIPAAIAEGKVVIKEDKVVVTAGEKIPADVAQMLTRLEIFPVEIGISLHAVFEDGNIYKPEVLDININEFNANIQLASQHAFAFAMATTWINKATIQPLLLQAYRNAINLSIDKKIVTKETIKQFISIAYTNMRSVSTHVQNASDKNLKKKIT